jgi:hypothetical protein
LVRFKRFIVGQPKIKELLEEIGSKPLPVDVPGWRSAA